MCFTTKNFAVIVDKIFDSLFCEVEGDYCLQTSHCMTEPEKQAFCFISLPKPRVDVTQCSILIKVTWTLTFFYYKLHTASKI